MESTENIQVITDPTSGKVDCSGVRRMSFVKAFKAEIKCWRRISQEDDALLRTFSACVAMRMRGEDPDTLLPKGA